MRPLVGAVEVAGGERPRKGFGMLSRRPSSVLLSVVGQFETSPLPSFIPLRDRRRTRTCSAT